MLQHEREYFVSRLRSGTYYIDYEGIKLKVLPPTVEDQFFINAAYKEAYDEAFSQDVMTNEDMMFWMYQKRFMGRRRRAKTKRSRQEH